MKAEEINLHQKYKVKVDYKRTDDLQKGSVKNGELIEVEAYWLIEEDSDYSGHWAMMPTDKKYYLWIPSCDLEFISTI